ncbi:hypothetical protein EJ05DRAFT_6347 [Pseudovirgaria hyperparasitica]|uniref:RRM domain-containing protein n=1 Tax=Pseudovirgaria hyperparasitica TaxID=470096 RepID=A0A6A6WK88_9PEZI|nr:uncharacterized protein EJ05DRAFT_6347 [Pseudovirgaria hyperparasitica]KAF2762573.1 hypothetical protein EJ05DRAFT_6347 [Pseudovirgaria hyperparasitica]
MAPKKNTQTLSLGEFLNDQALGSWADEMEDMPMPSSESRTGYGRSTGGPTGGWGGDRSGLSEDRGTPSSTPRDALPLPSRPPYTAYVGNLSFEDTLTTDVIGDFFKDEFEKAKASNKDGIGDKILTVTNVRIVTDRFEGKSKGFGYVEFGSVDALKFARDQINGASFYGRELRISVADPPKERSDARDIDWVRKGPPADLPNQRRPSDRGYNRFNDAEPEAGSERGPRRGPPAFEGDGKSRDLDKWERKGPLSPAPGAPGGMREGGRTRGNDLTVRERKQSPAWGEGRSETSRPPRREYQEKPAFEPRAREPTAPELDNQWRSKMRPDATARSPAGTPDVSTPSSPTATPAIPAVRQRLQLQKRTVSESDPSPSSAASDAKASPFGAARPIDTAAREREIEEKKQIALKEKKEADEKAREEKRAKDAVAKSEKKEAASIVEGKEESKEDDTGAGKNYEILRRMNDENAETDNDAEDANGEIVEDKAVKPKEIVRDPPRKPSGQNSWRKPATKSPVSVAQGTTAETLDADGWSTVPEPRSRGKRRGGGNQGARAIAS